jgi:hypothetical protein
MFRLLLVGGRQREDLGWAQTKGSAIQPNKVVLNPGGPIVSGRPLDAEACGQPGCCCGKGGRQAIDCHCRIA